MFVVRIVVDDQRIGRKAFSRKEDAEKRYWSGWKQTVNNKIQSISLFSVPNTEGAREAIAAVKRGDETEVQVLLSQECTEIVIKKVAAKINLSELGL